MTASRFCRTAATAMMLAACLAAPQPLHAQTPVDGATLASVASALMQKGEVPQALTVVETGLRTHPRSVPLLTIGGIAARTLRRYEDSRRYWETARSIEPGNIYVTENLVLAYQMAGDKVLRDRTRAELMKLREASSDPKTLKPSYVRDDFRVGTSIVMCLEYYTLEGAQAVRYQCSVHPSIKEPPVAQLALVTQDAMTEKARATGVTRPGDRYFMLVRQETGGNPQTYAGYPKEPSYDEFRGEIVLILEGKKQPVVPAAVKPSNAADEAIVTGFLAAREALARSPHVNVPEMSKVLRATLEEAVASFQRQDYSGALKRLSQLEKYAPLAELPSFDLQILLMGIHQKLGDADKAAGHSARATAMRELLSRRIGSGESVEDPKRVLMVNEITEWVRLQQARVVSTVGRPHNGRELLEVRYSGKGTGETPKLAYFEIDPRVQSAQQRQLRLFDPIPIASLAPRQLDALNKAREKRDRFLDDKSFAYDRLLQTVRTTMKAAMALDMQGKPAEALAKLQEIEAVRPIEDIPLVDLLSVYSALNGKLGNAGKQSEMRLLLFGINQAIAHSGDGSSAETAVQVITVDEEYAWLRDKGLAPVRQRLQNLPRGRFDVLTAKDAAGNERDYYFDVTRIFPRGLEGTRSPATPR